MQPAPTSTPRVYLAGPDVFFHEALETAQGRKEFLSGLRMEGVFPLDAQDDPSAATAASIFKANCALIDSCQALLANITPFRGPSADVGTVWEIGYARGQGKPVAAYSANTAIYREKVFHGGWSDAPHARHDKHGHEIEHFGDIDNLMVTQSVLAICQTFEEAAQALRRFLDQV
jgi:nucleoside 2-deoxyribosyltransferase